MSKKIEELKKEVTTEETKVVKFEPKKEGKIKKFWGMVKEHSDMVVAGSMLVAYAGFLVWIYVAAKNEIDEQQRWIEEHIDCAGVNVDGEPRLFVIAKDMREHMGEITADIAKSISEHVPNSGSAVNVQDLKLDAIDINR